VLRISVEQTSDGRTLVVEGRLMGPWVKELEACWRASRPRGSGQRLHVDLRQVGFVDAGGRQLLSRMSRQGAEFLAAGPMMTAILEECCSPPAPVPPAQHQQN
jgi:ABC-type transporter Mla MlaB component